MRHISKPIIPVLLVIIALVSYGVYYVLNITSQQGGQTVSGTIEATEIRLGSLMGGTARQVYVAEGDSVLSGQVLAPALQVRARPPAAPW